VAGIVLGSFAAARPPYVTDQARSLEWLAEAHAWSQATRDGLGPAERRDLARAMRRRLARFGCDPGKIQTRASVVEDFVRERWDEMTLYDVTRRPRGGGAAERSALFARAAGDYLRAAYARETEPPDELIHVTCTGYVAPSAAQELVAQRGWGARTRVTHAYHMGCNAALPAVRLAAGMLALAPAARVDIAHTELCTLHLDPSDHSAEQLVVQSLFADGLIRYAARAGGPGLRVLALHEVILPDCAGSMRWVAGDFGMHMVLGRDVPDRLAGPLPGFVDELYARAGLPPDRGATIFAVHPGGPRIIDQVGAGLGLADEQEATSRAVLRDHGNMSSATLPHVWMRLAADPAVGPGTLIASLAFGPGLTVCGGLFRKE
jgi:predicted naringenin-chalcone synthase